MNLEQLAEEIKINKSFAEEVIDGGNPQTLNNRLGRKESAKRRLEDLYVVYKKELNGKILSVLVTGSEAEEFANIAETTGNMYKASADNVYEDLVGRLNPVLYSGTESTAAIIETISRHVYDKAQELDLLEYPELYYKSKYARKISSKEEALALTKEVINTELGSAFAAYDVLEQVTRKAINAFFAGKVLPVVVVLKESSLTNELKEGLKSIGTVFTVLAGEGSIEADFKIEKTDQKSVINILKQINGTLNNKKKEKKNV